VNSLAVTGMDIFAATDGNGVFTAELNVILPVNLVSFISTASGNNVKLEWTTSSELNNKGFDIERSEVRSQTSDDWRIVGNVHGNGTGSSVQSYSFTDRNLASGKYKYRLKQIDYNGNFEYFNLGNEVVIGIPEKYSLSQNYPNPFNPSTTFNYEIPADGKVSLKVFDISGKEVADIVNEIQSAGYYTVNYNASALSSGVYFYTISSNEFTATKKFILMK
ncbi:MAG: T9SS type A sorting domain-containing protein, partial [Ignavibacteriae bacterium]|nr:T9SS type A sorting domain-containing protein [Ignavibacteriota bacterium]